MEENLKYTIGETILLEIEGVSEVFYNSSHNIVIVMEDGVTYTLKLLKNN